VDLSLGGAARHGVVFLLADTDTKQNSPAAMSGRRGSSSSEDETLEITTTGATVVLVTGDATAAGDSLAAEGTEEKYPQAELLLLNGRINQAQWVVPIRTGEPLDICLQAFHRFWREGAYGGPMDGKQFPFSTLLRRRKWQLCCWLPSPPDAADSQMMLRTHTHSHPTLCDRVSACPSLVPPCAGKAADNQACQHFFRGTMYTAFEKLLCSTAVAGWNSDIQRQILLRLRQLVALIVDVMHEQHAHIWRLLLMVSGPLQRWLAFTSVIAAKLCATLPSSRWWCALPLPIWR